MSSVGLTSNGTSALDQLRTINLMAQSSNGKEAAGRIGLLNGRVVKFNTHLGERLFGERKSADMINACNDLRKTLGDLVDKALEGHAELASELKEKLGCGPKTSKSLLDRSVVAKVIDQIQKTVGEQLAPEEAELKAHSSKGKDTSWNLDHDWTTKVEFEKFPREKFGKVKDSFNNWNTPDFYLNFDSFVDDSNAINRVSVESDSSERVEPQRGGREWLKDQIATTCMGKDCRHAFAKVLDIFSSRYEGFHGQVFGKTNGQPRKAYELLATRLQTVISEFKNTRAPAATLYRELQNRISAALEGVDEKDVFEMRLDDDDVENNGAVDLNLIRANTILRAEDSKLSEQLLKAFSVVVDVYEGTDK